MGTLHHILSVAVGRPEEDVHNIADVYAALEYMFYSLRLPLNRIFNYWINQTGQVAGDLFFQWNHYLHLCEELGNTDYFPDRFITAYNEALESAGMPPIIYEISEWGLGEAFFRNGTTFEFEGSFPCDSHGVPIMKWIGIKATNIKSFRCDCEKSKQGHLRIEITPSTVIYVVNAIFYESNSNAYNIFKTMSLIEMLIIDPINDGKTKGEMEKKLPQFLPGSIPTEKTQLFASIVRKLRNKIAHGDFEAIQKLLAQYREAFMEDCWLDEYEYSIETWVYDHICITLDKALNEILWLMLSDRDKLIKLQKS